MTLDDLIKKVADENDFVDPRELAQFVAKSAPARELRNLFAEAIIDDCRHHLMTQRNRTLNGDDSNIVRRSNRSPRLERQTNWWADFCAASLHVGDGVRKVLGDCTLVDLKAASEERRANIRGLQKNIDKYDHLSSMLVSYNVTHVRELPPDAVQDGLAA